MADLLAFALQEQASEFLTFTKAGRSALKKQLESAALQDPFSEVEAQIAPRPSNPEEPPRLERGPGNEGLR